MRTVRLVAVLALGAGLAGCHVPGGVVHRTLTVEFETADSGAARPVVISTCGHLPGVTVTPTQSTDPNVILDYSRASTAQFEALSSCVSGLENRRSLQISEVTIDDGTDN